MREVFQVGPEAVVSFFYFKVKQIRRAAGSSAVGAAAYRSASRLYDERQGRWHNYSDKPGVLWSKILTPSDQSWAGEDRSRFWNGVEAWERRPNAVVATEVLFALPKDLSLDACVDLATAYLDLEFCANNLIVDLNLHQPQSGGGVNLHAHALVSTRSLKVADAERTLSFGLKRSDIFDLRHLYDWRRSLAEHTNTALAEAGVDLQLDPRSYREQGVRLEPGIKVGAAAAGLKSRGLPANRARDNEDIALRNGDRIIADPTIALDALTWERSTFRRQDLERFLDTYGSDADQRLLARSAVEASPRRVHVGRDAFGRQHFTSEALVLLEAGLESRARSLLVADPERLRILSATGRGGEDSVASLAQEGRRRGEAVAGAALSRMAADGLQRRILAPVHVITLEGTPAYGQTPPPDPCGLLFVAQANFLSARQLQPLIEQGLQSGAKVILLTGDSRDRGPVGAALRAVREGLLVEQAYQKDDFDPAVAVAAFAARRGLHWEMTRESQSGCSLQPAHDPRFSHRVLRRFAEAELQAARSGENLSGSLSAFEARRQARDRLEILWPGAERRLEGSTVANAAGLTAAASGQTDALKRLVEERPLGPDHEAGHHRVRSQAKDLDR